MNLFRLARFFQPLQNAAGFGVADFVALGLALVAVAICLAWARVGPWLERVAGRTRLCMAGLAGLTVLLRLAILPTQPVPSARVADEYSYLLLGDTLAHFRLANAMHPMHRFFEGVFTLQEPAWSSIYPLGQGLVLALGQLVFGVPWAGVLLSCAALTAGVYWMLRAWTTPWWALVGGLLAVVQFGPLSAWMNLYWGGAVSAVAGCLIFGALGRLRAEARGRDAALLGAGLGLQMLTRPYEFVFVAAAVAVYALAYLWRVPRRGALVMMTFGPLALAGVLTLLHNHAVTGQWTKLPYSESRERYGVPSAFAFQKALVPNGPLTVEQQIDYSAQVTIHGDTPETPVTWLARLVKRAAFYRFFFLAPLYLALPAFLWCLRERVYWWVLGTILLLACGTTFYVYFYPHYVAAATCLFVLIAVKGLEQLTRLRVRGIEVGRETVRLILILCAGHFVFWYGLYAWGDVNVLRVMNPWEKQYAIPIGDPDGRIGIEAQLRKLEVPQLVLVHYTPEYHGDPWIHNAADIDGAHVVWALDLGEAEDAELLRYYAGRKAWLLDPDARPPRLTPYAAVTGR